MKISGIYKIESNIKPERIYVGSAVDIKHRWGVHLYDLRKGKHGSKKLQNHYNKYGLEDLRFSVLLGCNKEELIRNEQFFIDSYNPYFNICKIAGSQLGFRHSEESKKKISRIPSIEERIKMSERRKGHKDSEETRKNKSKSHMGLNTWAKGRKVPEEVILNLKGNKFAIRRPVINILTNKVYDSIVDAAKSIDIKYSTLSMQLLNINQNKTPLRYYDEFIKTA